jgi:hypothetical protein
MARSLYEVFLSLFRKSDGDGSDAGNDDDQFLPSPLDLSVRFSHGGHDTEADRELNEISKQAEKLERTRRDK